MSRVSIHSKERSIERIDEVNSFSDAKRYAKLAKTHGNTINFYQRYPKFFNYLQNKLHQTRTCSIRIYKDNIYIWRGKLQTLVTVHPIPDRYKIEMRAVDNAQN